MIDWHYVKSFYEFKAARKGDSRIVSHIKKKRIRELKQRKGREWVGHTRKRKISVINESDCDPEIKNKLKRKPCEKCWSITYVVRIYLWSKSYVYRMVIMLFCAHSGGLAVAIVDYRSCYSSFSFLPFFLWFDENRVSWRFSFCVLSSS